MMAPRNHSFNAFQSQPQSEGSIAKPAIAMWKPPPVPMAVTAPEDSFQVDNLHDVSPHHTLDSIPEEKNLYSSSPVQATVETENSTEPITETYSSAYIVQQDYGMYGGSTSIPNNFIEDF
jgi:hypothetical protein